MARDFDISVRDGGCFVRGPRSFPARRAQVESLWVCMISSSNPSLCLTDIYVISAQPQWNTRLPRAAPQAPPPLATSSASTTSRAAATPRAVPQRGLHGPQGPREALYAPCADGDY